MLIADVLVDEWKSLLKKLTVVELDNSSTVEEFDWSALEVWRNLLGKWERVCSNVLKGFGSTLWEGNFEWRGNIIMGIWETRSRWIRQSVSQAVRSIYPVKCTDHWEFCSVFPVLGHWGKMLRKR